LALNPEDILKRGNQYKINSTYYITKCIIPALERTLGLTGVNIKSWYFDMKKRKVLSRHINYDEFEINKLPDTVKNHHYIRDQIQSKYKVKQKSMDQYLYKTGCVNCGRESIASICPACQDNKADTILSLQTRLMDMEKQRDRLENICYGCSSHVQRTDLFKKNELLGLDCCSCIDCPIFYDRWKLTLRIEDHLVSVENISLK
jgi:DNA polymerase zeta